jgi:apolipoprotein D and lipocalin family protein
MKKKILLLLMTFILLLSCKAQKSMIDKTVVNDVDIQRYLGVWYEIARYDHRFERDLVGVTATYSYRKDGKIKVVNSGYKKTLDGKKSEAIGKAKIPDPDLPSKLKVSFFLCFYGDYYILELDDDYQWAVIGSSSDNYLWILSRVPVMDKSIYNNLIKILVNRGYDVDKLIRVKQKE